MKKAIALTEYGRRLSSHFQFPGDPPFENTYEDHGIYFRILLGEDVDAGLDHFLKKVEAFDSEEAYNPSAEVYVELLSRLGRLDQAIEVTLKYLKNPAGMGGGGIELAELCQEAGDFTGLLRQSREQGDLVNFTAAMVEQSKLDSRTDSAAAQPTSS